MIELYKEKELFDLLKFLIQNKISFKIDYGKEIKVKEKKITPTYIINVVEEFLDLKETKKLVEKGFFFDYDKLRKEIK